MSLKKYKIKNFIETINIKCGDPNLNNDDISGIGRDKEFFEPSKQVGKDTSSYKVVPPGCFACNLMHVGRDIVLPVAINRSSKSKVVSGAYTVFKVNDESIILKDYFFIFLNSNEKDRFFWFNCDGSVRDGMEWDVFVNLEIEIPSIEIQQKYVDIYNAMVENQKSYERGLTDLKLICESHIENISKRNRKRIGNYITRNIKRNVDVMLDKSCVKGFNNNGEFIKPARLFSGDISTFKLIQKNYFVYNSRINNSIKRLSVAINENEDLLVSPAYESFYVCDDKELYPYYLYMLLQRESFARKVLFNSFGSSTVVFTFDNLCEFEIPIPNIHEQIAISNIYRAYKERNFINEYLKQQIKNICPILIKGSIEEGKKE